ncbi:MAG TPA: hypothetical protein VJ798_05865 [Rhizomicrobium sp.]|nr:hypothetical protein [Rhizomicrobium sp.]
MRATALALLIFSLTTATAAAAEKRAYRLDNITATAVPGGIRIEAKGAVQSGGWSHARLKLSQSDARTVVVEFLAQPPAAGKVVIMGLLPVNAQVTVRAGHGVTSVRAIADANEVTAQVLR